MTIFQIIDKIDQHQWYVPTFQREYVWKNSDAKKLMESLIKEYPTGSMLTRETSNPPKIKGNYPYRPEQGEIKLILDGQQRITTLYMIITGRIPPYYTLEEIENDTRNIFVNLESLELEYFSKNKMASNPLWVNLTDIFQKRLKPREIIKQLQEKQVVSDLLEDLIHDNYLKIERILDRDFVEQKIPPKATLKEAIDIFYIVNASGVNLTDAELALAQISGYWPEARDLFKAKLDELESHGFVFKLDFVVYLLLGILYSSGSDMEKLHSPDNLARVQEVWHLLSGKVLDYVCNILRSHAYVDHTKEINSIYALIPLIVFVYYKPGQKMSEQEIAQAVKRFYYSQIRVRYVSQLQQRLTQDLAIVRNSATPFDDLLMVIKENRPLIISEDEFIGARIQHPLFALMKWYFKSQDAVCLSTGLSIRQNMGKKYSLELDHIFPYSLLKEYGYDMNNRHHYALAQEISNRALLTQEANRNKSNMDASVYLEQVANDFPHALKIQLIPENRELWKLENYELFLKKRRQMLATELNQFLESLSFSTENALQVSILDLIAEGESKYLEFKSSLRRDSEQGVVNKALEQVVLKVIASFSNAQGGTLLIGVNDSGEVLGLQNDYDSLQGTRDEFELHLTNLISKTFGADFRSMSVHITFPLVESQEICMVEVQPGDKPLYLDVLDKSGQKSQRFYARSGNSSWEFGSLEEAANYIGKRFK